MPSWPFNAAPALECFLPNISITVCFPIRRAFAKTGSALPALQRERQLRSSAFPNQTDNLSLRCFSRKSKKPLYSFSSQTGAFIFYVMVGGDPGCAFKSPSQPVTYSDSDLPFAHIWCPAVPFNTGTSTWVLFAKYFNHSMLPYPQSVAKTGSALPALQRERQLRSSAFPNQTDNLSLRCFSRKSKNHCILFPVRLVPSLLHHGGRWSLVCPSNRERPPRANVVLKPTL